MVRGKAVEGSGLDVGFICQGWSPDVGGIETLAKGLATALAGRGHRVHVLCLDYGEGREPYSTRDEVVDGVAVRRMAYLYHDHAALADVVLNKNANDVVLAWLAETPCDIVHAQHLTGFGLGALAAVNDVGLPLVMTLHDYWGLCPRGQMLRNDDTLCERPEADACAACLGATWPHLMPSTGGRGEGPGGEPLAGDVEATAARTEFALGALRLPQRLFSPSARTREVYAAAGLEPERIQVVENGIGAAELAAEARRLRAASARGEGDELRLGVLGTMIPSKGQLELVRAFRKADVAGLGLDLYGNMPPYHGDDAYIEELRAIGREDPHVRVHGPYTQDELPGILAGLDGVAAPSRWEEVYGLTVREARAAGLPVLVSAAGGLPAVAAGGEAGLVVPRDDEEAWGEALRRFASDADARARWAACEAPLRTTGDMMLELERAYVEVIREVTGLMPSLVHPIEGLAGDAPASSTSAPAADATAPKPARRGLLGRLFGRG
ncbi:MAG: glycosyltransferase [Planctomycetota bacterium]